MQPATERVSPAESKRLSNYSHSITRGIERYGLDPAAIPRIAAMIQQSHERAVPIRVDRDFANRTHYGVFFGGQWIAVCYDNATSSPCSFLPPEALDKYLPQLSGMVEKQRPKAVLERLKMPDIDPEKDAMMVQLRLKHDVFDEPIPEVDPIPENPTIEQLSITLEQVKARNMACNALTGKKKQRYLEEIERLRALKSELKQRRHVMQEQARIAVVGLVEPNDAVMLRFSLETISLAASLAPDLWTSKEFSARVDAIKAYGNHIPESPSTLSCFTGST